jgi:hypothetical protein
MNKGSQYCHIRLMVLESPAFRALLVASMGRHTNSRNIAAHTSAQMANSGFVYPYQSSLDVFCDDSFKSYSDQLQQVFCIVEIFALNVKIFEAEDLYGYWIEQISGPDLKYGL